MRQKKENKKTIIFIGGIHGVGKGSICRKICNKTNAIHLVASDLLNWEEISDVKNKKVKNIKSTQDRLIVGLRNVVEKNKLYLLDGHFCLFNSEGGIEKIPREVFKKIDPRLIAIVTTNVNKVKTRLEKRDGKIYNLDVLKEMQFLEMKYAKQIALEFNVPFFEMKGGDSNGFIKLISELD